MPVRKPNSWPTAHLASVEEVEQLIAAIARSDWRTSDTSIGDALVGASIDTVIVCYRHPVHDFYNWSAEAPLNEAITFLNERFNAERGEGLDLDVALPDFSAIWAGNHDGEQFRVR